MSASGRYGTASNDDLRAAIASPQNVADIDRIGGLALLVTTRASALVCEIMLRKACRRWLRFFRGRSAVSYWYSSSNSSTRPPQQLFARATTLPETNGTRKPMEQCFDRFEVLITHTWRLELELPSGDSQL